MARCEVTRILASLWCTSADPECPAHPWGVSLRPKYACARGIILQGAPGHPRAHHQLTGSNLWVLREGLEVLVVCSLFLKI